jgi:hypothetical protein
MLAPGADEERGFGVNLLTPVPIEDSLPPRDVPSQFSPEMLASLDTQCRDFFRSDQSGHATQDHLSSNHTAFSSGN